MHTTEYRGTVSEEHIKEFETTLYYIDPELKLSKIPVADGYIVWVDFMSPGHYRGFIKELEHKKLILP